MDLFCFFNTEITKLWYFLPNLFCMYFSNTVEIMLFSPIYILLKSFTMKFYIYTRVNVCVYTMFEKEYNENLCTHTHIHTPYLRTLLILLKSSVHPLLPSKALFCINHFLVFLYSFPTYVCIFKQHIPSSIFGHYIKVYCIYSLTHFAPQRF